MSSLTRILIAVCILLAALPGARGDSPVRFIDAQIAANAGKSGVYVLDTGTEALLARAWLADHAKESVEVQYFIWSTDNIGILAAEALLRAAERGVRVRVIVDDLLIDAPDKSLLALARHPKIDIRIYNPQTSVGVPLHKRLLNVLTDFRGVNQRMHDKTLRGRRQDCDYRRTQHGGRIFRLQPRVQLPRPRRAAARRDSQGNAGELRAVLEQRRSASRSRSCTTAGA